MDLVGMSSLGPIHVGLHPSLASTGQIEERSNLTPGLLDLAPFSTDPTGVLQADSFFDVHFEITVGNDPAMPFFTEKAKRMSAVITHKPPDPGNVYENMEEIPLLDASGRPTGYFIGASRHEPNPPDEVEVDVFPETVGQLLVEVPGPIITPESSLPPTDGVYRSAANVHAEFVGPELQIVLMDIRHRPINQTRQIRQI